MKERMRNALLQMYKNLDEAGVRQAERGGHDQGSRSKVTGGKHLNVVAEVLRDDLIEAGFSESDVYFEGGCLTLPGWFRPSKAWDLMAFADNELMAVVELKSINSSFGNNANNRAEESLGSAVDIAHAVKNELIPYSTTPPVLGYVLVVKECPESTNRGVRSKRAVYPIDKAFNQVSYLERLTILCRRLMAERLYQAVWIVAVNPESGDVIEPDDNLTYEKFLTTIRSRLAVHRA